MISLTILTILVLVLPPFGIGPVIVRGGMVAWNNPVMVKLPEDEVTESQNQSPEGRKAQELADFWLGWFVALALAWPVVLLMRDVAYVDLWSLLLATFCRLWTKLFNKQWDLIGHGVEILVAEREGREGYRAEEIARLKWDSKFSEYSEADLALRIRKWEPVSKALLFILQRRVK